MSAPPFKIRGSLMFSERSEVRLLVQMPSSEALTLTVGLKSTNCFTAARLVVSGCANSHRAPVSEQPFITQPIHDALSKEQVCPSNSMPLPEYV